MITTENFYMRFLRDSDFGFCKLLWEEDSQLGQMYKSNPEIFEKVYWDDIKDINDEIYLIFEKSSNDFCGKIELQYSSGKYKELGIVLLEEHQNKGIGTEVIVAFSQWLNKVKGLDEVVIRIDPENKRSQHVFEKLGARFIEQKSGLSKSMEDFFRRSDENLDLDAIGPYFYKLAIPIEKINSI